MAKFDVYNLEKQKVGAIDLSDAVFAAEVNPHLLYEAVKMQQISRRSGTVAVKNRGLVSGGGKKPWKQKGTGRARQGSIRASHWVGGGKAMGPKQRDYAYRPPLKVRKGALRSAISLRAKEGQLWILEGFELAEFKTKRAAGVFVKLGLADALIVEVKENLKLHRSVRNLAAFDAIAPEGLNVEDLLRHPALVLTTTAAKAIDTRLA
jgi:large subunit ribosomal protein L4